MSRLTPIPSPSMSIQSSLTKPLSEIKTSSDRDMPPTIAKNQSLRNDKNPNSKHKIPLLMSLNIHVPRDKRFGHLKMSDFLTLSLKSVIQTLLPRFKEWFNNTPNRFDSTNEVLKLYERGIKLPQGPVLKAITNSIPLEIIKDIIFKVDSLLKFDAKNENCHSISALIDASANVNRRDSNRDSVMSLAMKLGNLDSV
ncbi:hypothetical protein FXO37_10219 [Capsicum annuum]|nr:hypothetical protein FXO37_10219 [Capsicum annuum]